MTRLVLKCFRPPNDRGYGCLMYPVNLSILFIRVHCLASYSILLAQGKRERGDASATDRNLLALAFSSFENSLLFGPVVSKRC